MSYDSIRMSLKAKTEEILSDTEKFIGVAYKASGITVKDVMGIMDAETGAVVGSAMTIYKGAKDLAVMYANVMDQTISELEDLKRMNRELREQNITLLENENTFIAILERNTAIQGKILDEIKSLKKGSDEKKEEKKTK